GSYGLTGVILFQCQDAALRADTFLLSCRALGRGVEHCMVARLGEIALERGLARVEIPFVASGRNRPAELFLESLALATLRSADATVFQLPAAAAAAVRYSPGKHVPAAGAAHADSVPSRPAGRPVPR